MSDLVDRIIQYESEAMEDDEVFALFQELVDTGMAWQLQGSYGRMARFLIDEGLITEPTPDPSTTWTGYSTGE